MIVPTVSLKGLKSVQAAFEKLDRDMRVACAEAIKGAGEKVAADAKSSAPARTGKYRKAIRSRFVNNKISPYCRVASWFKGRPSPLGHLIEFGHRAVNGTFVSGAPHLLPAFERHKRRIAGEIQEGIGG